MKPPPLLTFLCLLVAPAGGNLVQFGVMIERMTGKSALQYNDYGCYCGLGGSHWPVDPTDWCCHAHDCCYGRLEKLGCDPKLERYLFSVSRDNILCAIDSARQLCQGASAPSLGFMQGRADRLSGQCWEVPAGRTDCQRQTCECDRTAALCFRRNLGTYDRKYAHYPNKLCTGPTPPC